MAGSDDLTGDGPDPNECWRCGGDLTDKHCSDDPKSEREERIERGLDVVRAALNNLFNNGSL